MSDTPEKLKRELFQEEEPVRVKGIIAEELKYIAGKYPDFPLLDIEGHRDTAGKADIPVPVFEHNLQEGKNVTRTSYIFPPEIVPDLAGFGINTEGFTPTEEMPLDFIGGKEVYDKYREDLENWVKRRKKLEETEGTN